MRSLPTFRVKGSSATPQFQQGKKGFGESMACSLDPGEGPLPTLEFRWRGYTSQVMKEQGSASKEWSTCLSEVCMQLPWRGAARNIEPATAIINLL
jgi:hypothetical protein